MSNISIHRNDGRELLSVAEACASLGIRKTTFFKLAGERKIETVKLGRRTLVRVGELQRFIASLPCR
jgi:excisionase family DNA binding protein